MKFAVPARRYKPNGPGAECLPSGTPLFEGYRELFLASVCQHTEIRDPMSRAGLVAIYLTNTIPV